jgi:uncharacterized protein
MKEETLEQLIIQVIEYADGYVTFAFQGGEPMLSGLDFFRKVVELQKKHNKKNLTIENTIQTNGILVNDEWAEFFAENHFLVGLSLDGPKKIHDRYRTDGVGKPTFTKVMNSIELFNKYHVDYNILSVITNASAKKASYLYNFYKRNHFEYIQLIPCMDENTRGEGNTRNEYAVEPVQYGKFLIEMFDIWYEDFIHGESMDIRMFSNLAQMAAGYPAEECGMNGCCTCYFVVEGDGSVYPCDFYCFDEWKLGTVQNSFLELSQSVRAKQFVDASMGKPEKCNNCPYFRLCRGGCRRWRENADTGINELCPAYQMFFKHCTERIEKLGQVILQRYGEYRI